MPATSAVIVLTLALGIGVNTTFFSFFNGMVLKPLPFEDPERLVALNQSQPKLGVFRRSIAAANLRDWKEEQNVFVDVAPYVERGLNLATEENPERITGGAVARSLFPLLGIAPALGRNFSDEEDRPGGARVVLISDALWKRRFAGDAAVVGRILRVDDRPHEIIGVLPPGVKFPNFAEIWTPLALDPADTNRALRRLDAIARLSPGVTVDEAQKEMAAIASRLEARYPGTNTGWSVKVWPLRDAWLPPVTQFSAFAAQASVFFVLLIVCANVANLMLAHATSRRQETALRGALGANRGVLLRQFLTESSILALAGGLLGSVLSLWGVEGVKRLVLVPIPYWLRFDVDETALFFALGITVLAGGAFGLVPALRSTGKDLYGSLKAGGRTDDATGGNRLRHLLVVAQFAMSVVLLVGALLLIKSFLRLQQVETGYAPRGVLTLRLALAGEAYADPARRVGFLDDVLREIAEVPGVESAGVTNYLPASNHGYRSAVLEAEGRPGAVGEERVTNYHLVSARYPETLSVPLVSGRLFTSEEVTEGRDVVVVSRGLAEELWPHQDPLGRRLRLVERPPGPWLTVVGTVGDVAPAYVIGGLDLWPKTQVYAPFGRDPQAIPTLAVRSRPDAAPAVLAAVRRVDPSVPVYEVQTLERVLSAVHWVPRIWSQQFSIFAVLALVIAALGSYGVTSYAVSRRTREMGIRVALGASRREIHKLVVGQGVRLAAAGITIGLVAALPLSRLLKSLLHDVSASDPGVFLGVIALLGASSALASYLPARRAARIAPAVALRAGG